MTAVLDDALHTPAGPVAPGRRGPFRWALAMAVRGATGLPLAVAAVPMALTGGAGPAARAQRLMVRRFGAGPARTPGFGGTRPGALRVVGHSLLVLLPALVAFVAVALGAFGIYSGYLYFLRPDASFALGHPFTADHRFDHSWGGPTLVGAWFVHSCVAFGIQVLALLLVRAPAGVQDRLTRRLLGC